MDYPLYLGSICILLEDLGFTQRPRNAELKIQPMTYCRYYFEHIYDKIFVDVTTAWTIEMLITFNSNSHQLLLDRWYKKRNATIYLVQERLNIDICHPNSILDLKEFVIDTISLSKTYEPY